MKPLNEDLFVCLDIETTGLSLERDGIVEVAALKFTFKELLESYHTLVDPKMNINKLSENIHHITNDMVSGKPTIDMVLPKLFEFVNGFVVVGHNINFDINFLNRDAKKHNIESTVTLSNSIDTLRLARLYGESPDNRLQTLRRHFNVEERLPAHRAISDVNVNSYVFKSLSKNFKTTLDILDRLKRPIQLKKMPFGKYKDLLFDDIPKDYLYWASQQKFDQDLLYSIEHSLRKKNSCTNHPFKDL